jgi:hypothetical protein
VLTHALDLNPTGVKVLSSKQQIKVLSAIHIDDSLLVTSSPANFLNDGQNEIIVYDARVPATLVQVQRYVVNNDISFGSSSANWDFYTSSWLSNGDGVGILAIPLRVRDLTQQNPKGNFDGYMLYDVSLTAGVSRRSNVSHVESEKYYKCYENKLLAERLIVINGTMTTTKGHSILSTNLKTGRNRWKLEITNSSKLKCCFSWYTPPQSICNTIT